MYIGRPFEVNKKITIYQPTVGEIIDFGEQQYYAMIHTLTCIPSDMKSKLDDMDINYMEVENFELFAMLSRGLTPESTKLVLGDLDLSDFELKIQVDTNQPVLYHKQTDTNIDKLIYMKIVEYIRKVHGIRPKVEKAATETTRKLLIDIERKKIKKAQKEPYTSQLRQLVSSMMRYPGCTMTLKELLDLPLCAFMDLVQGSQIYVSSTALLQGIYSGMVDCSKIDKKEFNWMRSLDN